MRVPVSTYAEQHANQTNLMIHLFAVPLFIIAHVLLVVALLYLDPIAFLLAAGAIGVSLAVQGKGHKLESLQPDPFTGAGNFIVRIYREQFYTFPRFVFTGELRRNLRRG